MTLGSLPLLSLPYTSDLEVCFSDSPPNFEVTEGDKVDIALKTNREFSVPFCVTLTTSDGSAVGELVVAILMYLCQTVHGYSEHVHLLC